jgi:hypothetical protein
VCLDDGDPAAELGRLLRDGKSAAAAADGNQIEVMTIFVDSCREAPG